MLASNKAVFNIKFTIGEKPQASVAMDILLKES
jgi:hypothetical protein